VALVRLAQMCQHERLLKHDGSSRVAAQTHSCLAAECLYGNDARGQAAYLKEVKVMQKAVVVVRRPGSGHVEGELDAGGQLVVLAMQQIQLLMGIAWRLRTSTMQ
jgi:hypothetical protein